MLWAPNIIWFSCNEDSKICTYKTCAYLEIRDSPTLAFGYVGSQIRSLAAASEPEKAQWAMDCYFISRCSKSF